MNEARVYADGFERSFAEVKDLLEFLAERGRNAKSVTMAKHATMIDYRMATGFEALMGYLYLTEQFDRLVELAGYGLEKIGEFETE